MTKFCIGIIIGIVFAVFARPTPPEFSSEPTSGSFWACYVADDQHLRCAPIETFLDRMAQGLEEKTSTETLSL